MTAGRVALLRRAAPRLLLAHALAYPQAFVWAMAAIPLSILAVPEAALSDASVDVVVQIVLRKLAWPAIGVFVVEHFAALPWALAKDGASDGPAGASSVVRARRAFWLATAALFAVALLGGGASWLWLIFR